MLGGVVGAGGRREQGEGKDGDEEWAHRAAQPSARCATLSAMVIDDLDTLLDRALRLIAEGRPQPSSASPGRPAAASRRWRGSSWPRWATRPCSSPMDGFHLAQSELVRLGRRDRMGAPDTFDAAGYAALLARLRARARGRRLRARVPARDRGAVRGRDRVPREIPLVVTEGNYLLVDVATGRGAAAARRGVVRRDGRGHAARVADPAPHRVRQDARRRARLGDALRSGQRRGDRRHARARRRRSSASRRPRRRSCPRRRCRSCPRR